MRARVTKYVAIAAAVPVGLGLVAGSPASADVNGLMVWVTQSGVEQNLYFQLAPGQGGPFVLEGAQRHPDFSRANGAVAFSTVMQDHLSTAEIYVFRGGAVEQLTNDELPDLDPEFSPDGNDVVFVHEDQFHSPAIEIMSAADGGERRELAVNGVDPSYSPGGAYVVYSGNINGRGNALRVVTADGQHDVVVHTSEHDMTYPSFSPDGHRILYTQIDERNTGDLFSYDIESGAVTQLTDTPDVDEYTAKYSPDGTQLLYDAIVNGRRGVYTAAADGSGAALVSDPATNAMDPDWRAVPEVAAPAPEDFPIPEVEEVVPEQPQEPAPAEPQPAPQPQNPEPADPGAAPQPQNPQPAPGVPQAPGAPQQPQPAPRQPGGSNPQAVAGPVITVKGKPRAGGRYSARKVSRLRGSVTSDAELVSVRAGVKLRQGSQCRHIKRNGALGRSTNCRFKLRKVGGPVLSQGRFRVKLNRTLATGRYKVKIKAIDVNAQRAVSRFSFRIR